jgi:hypothetical protein
VWGINAERGKEFKRREHKLGGRRYATFLTGPTSAGHPVKECVKARATINLTRSGVDAAINHI